MKDKLKAIDIKFFLVPLLILVFLFLVMGTLVVTSQVRDEYAHYKEMTVDMAQRYSDMLAYSSDAQIVVTGLLEEKLTVALQAVQQYDGPFDSVSMQQLATRLRMDDIHLYDGSGRIIHSTVDAYIGWEAAAGHPVHDFMTGGSHLRIEQIREDTENGVPYKFAYLRNVDSTFIQVGILAEHIQHFLGRFDYQSLVNRVFEEESLLHISFIDEQFTIVASSIERLQQRVIENPSLREQLGSEDYQIRRTTFDDQPVLFASVPVFSRDLRLGTLAIAWSTDQLVRLTRTIIFRGVGQLIVILLFMGGILYYAYRKNLSNIKLAYYDKLTLLPNETYFNEIINNALATREIPHAMLLMHFRNLRTLLLAYGDAYVDQLLIEVAGVLASRLAPRDRLFRLTSDRFAIVRSSYADANELTEFAHALVGLLGKPLAITQEQPVLEPEIGVVELDGSILSVDKLLQDGMLALSQIDAKRGDSVKLFSGSMEKLWGRQQRLQRELRMIIEDPGQQSFFLHYQPKLDLGTGRVTGFESLARMHVPDLGPVSPLEFIEIAEKSLLIYELGNLILHKACAFLRHLHDQGHTHIHMAVNISSLQLLRDSFISDVEQVVQAHAIPQGSLELEITESVLLEDFELVVEKLQAIRNMGVAISLDDFGTGYSSFARLRELPVNTVKIDRHFVKNIRSEQDPKVIIGDMISMIHRIGMTVVAEGVETEVQKDYLKAHGCDLIQGYLLSKPVSEGQALAWISYGSDIP